MECVDSGEIHLENNVKPYQTRNAFVAALSAVLAACGGEPGASSSVADDDKPVVFEATIESLQQYEAPVWFRDAKLGIYLHWGAYSVAERGE